MDRLQLTVMTLLLEQAATRTPSLSWAATLAALVAFGALLVTYGPIGGPDTLILATLMGLLLALRLTGWHLPPLASAHWAVRLALFAAVVAANWDKFNDPPSWLFDTGAVGAFGILAAAEMVVQAARTLPPGGGNGGALCLLSGYVFLAACTTDQPWPIRLASPLYFALAVLALPRYGPAQQGGPVSHHAGPAPRGDRTGEAGRGLAIAGALALGACVYAVFWAYRVPLMQIGAGGLHDRPPAEATGLSSQPLLEATFGQPGSLERVLRIVQKGEQSAQAQTYLRGLAYDTYGQGRWGPVADPRSFAPFVPQSRAGAAHADALQVTTLAPVRGVLFVPLRATGVWVAPGAGVALEQDPRSGGFHLHATIPPPYAVSFGGRGSPPLLAAALAPGERARDLAVPADVDPRVLALARQVTVGATTPAGKADAVQRFFLQNFQYSLTIHPGPGDPVSRFILERKAAHCEFFASGAVLMLRAVGLPARYVTGYYAHESAGADALLVRQQDAHAWAEVWLVGQGWTTLDATPGGGRPPATAAPVPMTRRAGEWMGDRIAAVRAWLARFTTGQIVGALAALAGAYWGIRELWKRWRRGASGEAGFAYAQAAEMGTLARRFERWLGRVGLPCPPMVPWEEHVQACGLGDAVLFVRGYNAARFGQALGTDTRHALEIELRRLEQTTAVPAVPVAAA